MHQTSVREWASTRGQAKFQGNSPPLLVLFHCSQEHKVYGARVNLIPLCQIFLLRLETLFRNKRSSNIYNNIPKSSTHRQSFIMCILRICFSVKQERIRNKNQKGKTTITFFNILIKKGVLMDIGSECS